jgi:F-type H+-transporting ATPase subunit alpha
MLKQPQYQPMPVENQVAAIYAVTNGHLDHLPITRIRAWERGFHEHLKAQHEEVLTGVREQKELTEELERKLVAAIKDYAEVFAAEEGVRVEAAAG